MNLNSSLSENKIEIFSGCGQNAVMSIEGVSDVSTVMHSIAPQDIPVCLDGLNSVVSLLPNLMASNEMAKNCYYKVVVNGNLAKAKNIEGGFRAFVIGDKGVNEQAVLFKPKELSALVNFASVFGVVSMAVGQKHLADINRKLEKITQQLNSISEYQYDERTSDIKFHFGQMVMICNRLRNDSSYKLSSTDLKEIDSCYIELGKRQEHLAIQVEKYDNELLHHDIQVFERFVCEWKACFEARMMALFIKKILLIDELSVGDRLDKLGADLNCFMKMLSDFVISGQDGSELLVKLKNFFNFDQSLTSRSIVQAISCKGNLLKDLSNSASQLTKIIGFDSKSIILKIDSGKVVSVHR